jgi:hypothetical protein
MRAAHLFGDVSVYLDFYLWFHRAVGFEHDLLKVPAFFLPDVFHGEKVALLAGIVEPGEHIADIVRLFLHRPQNPERVSTFRDDTNRGVNVFARLSRQLCKVRLDGGEPLYRAENDQRKLLPPRVVAVDQGGLGQALAAIAFGVDIDDDVSLAAGRDLPRIGGNRASSAGSYVFDDQGGVTGVADRKGMGNLRSFHHRIERVPHLFDFDPRRRRRLARGGHR